MQNSNLLKSPVGVLFLVVVAIVLAVLVPVAAPLIGIVLIAGGIMLLRRHEANMRGPHIMIIVAGSVLLVASLLVFITQLRVG